MERNAGSGWVVIGPGTAWTDAALSSYVVNASGRPFQWRVVDGWCELAGQLVTQSILSASSPQNLGTGLPAPRGGATAEWPDMPVGAFASASTPITAAAQIRADGGLRIYAAVTFASGSVITLDGARYRVS